MRRALLVLVLVSAGCNTCSGPPTPDDRFGRVGEFRLTERSGQTVTRDELRGKVWVASFIFTCCTQACPQISGSMARLQHELADQFDAVLVSFSVNPDADTPEQLRTYADNFQADPKRWLFLTGPREPLYQLIRESFHLGVEPTQGEERRPGNEVLHSQKLVVVDRQGEIRGYFDGTQPDDVTRLKQKVLDLLREQP